MLPIIILSVVVRLVGLNQSLWLDEAIQVLAVKNYGWWDLVSQYAIADFHPVFYHLVLKGWTSIFGYSEVSVRLPSVIFGVLTVYFVYKLGGKKFGLVAGLFMALNPLAVYYSQEARMYSLATLAIAGAAYFFQIRNYFWWGIFFLAGLYTDYLVWFMIPVFLLFRQERDFWLRMIVILLLLLPSFVLLKDQLAVGMQTAVSNPLWGKVVGGVDIKSVLLVLVKFVFGRISVGWLAIACLAYLWILLSAKNKFYWLWLVVPVLIGFALSFIIPVFSYFRFLFVLPAFILLLAEGARNRLVIGLICFVSLFSLVWFNLNSKFHREDWRRAVDYMEKNGKVVYFPSKAQAAGITYYSDKLIVLDRSDSLVIEETPIFLVRYVQEIFDPNDEIRTRLESNNYKLTSQKVFDGLVVIWKYEK